MQILVGKECLDLDMVMVDPRYGRRLKPSSPFAFIFHESFNVLTHSSSSLKRAKQLLEKGKIEEAVPYLLKAQQDPDNLDECVSLAKRMMPASAAITYFKSAEALGEVYLH